MNIMYLHQLFILFLHEDNKMKFEENNLAHTKRKKSNKSKNRPKSLFYFQGNVLGYEIFFPDTRLTVWYSV